MHKYINTIIIVKKQYINKGGKPPIKQIQQNNEGEEISLVKHHNVKNIQNVIKIEEPNKTINHEQVQQFLHLSLK